MSSIECIIADITTQQADAMVMPAHKHLIRGRGLSAQVFDKIGAPLRHACEQCPPCSVGEAVTTPAFNLPYQYIIHTVTPQWSSGDISGSSDLTLLTRCYHSAITEAAEKGCKRVIFAALGAGTNHFPQALSAHQGLAVLQSFTEQFDSIKICLANVEAQHIWQETQQRYYH